MSCHRMSNGGIICLANMYQYGGFRFEFHAWMGPMRVNKDLNPSKRQGRKFYKVITKWCQLTKRQKEKTRIYG